MIDRSSRQQGLTLKALADNANDVRGTVSNSLSADLRQTASLQGYIVMDQLRQIGGLAGVEVVSLHQ